MSKKVDIDTILADTTLELVLGGNTYIIIDIALETFLKASKDIGEGDNEELHKQLAILLDVEIDNIRHIGFKAAGLALNEIKKWVLDMEVGDDKTSSNP